MDGDERRGTRRTCVSLEPDHTGIQLITASESGSNTLEQQQSSSDSEAEGSLYWFSPQAKNRKCDRHDKRKQLLSDMSKQRTKPLYMTPPTASTPTERQRRPKPARPFTPKSMLATPPQPQHTEAPENHGPPPGPVLFDDDDLTQSKQAFFLQSDAAVFRHPYRRATIPASATLQEKLALLERENKMYGHKAHALRELARAYRANSQSRDFSGRQLEIKIAATLLCIRERVNGNVVRNH